MNRRSLLGLAGGLLLTGCAGFFTDAQTVQTSISIAEEALESIQVFIDHEVTSLDATIKDKIDAALQVARDALIVVNQALTVAKDVHDVNLVQAFDDFKKAYQAVLDLVAPLGVLTSSTSSKAKAVHDGKPHLVVPAPEALRLQR